MKPERIGALTGLRAVAMLTIFCSHLGCLDVPPYKGLYALLGGGRLGVNFFLVLSGFVVAYGYSGSFKGPDTAGDIRFVKKRVLKLYLPYLVTMILALPLHIINFTAWEGSLDVRLLLTRLCINLAMVQSAVPFAKYSVSINDVAWFISTIVIIYLLTPGILRLNQKVLRGCSLRRLLFLAAVLLMSYGVTYMVIRQIEFVSFADRGLSIIYRSPLIRIFPYLLGIIGYNFYCLCDRFRIKKGTYAQAAALALFLIWWTAADKTGLRTMAIEGMDMLVSMLVILVFVISDGGIVSSLLGRGKLYQMGNTGLEFYLVHYPVIEYGTMAARHAGPLRGIAVLPLTLLFFAVSLGIASLIHHFGMRKPYGKTTDPGN